MANTKQSKILCPPNSRTVRGYDILGSIAIVKFDWDEKQSAKKRFANKFLKERKSVRTVLEKSGKFSGRLRTLKTKWVAGEKTKEALYKENDCLFRLNVDSCYFSPRLSSERREIASKVKKGEEVLVMFGGVGSYAVVIGKKSKVRRVVSVELGREPSKYALENVKRNKLENVEVVQGDVRKKVKGKFDRIVMPRPNLKDSFLDVAFKSIRKGGQVHYYGFTENRKFFVPKTFKKRKEVLGYFEDEKGKLKELILREAKKARKKVKILKIKKAGDIGVRKFRYRVDFKIL